MVSLAVVLRVVIGTNLMSEFGLRKSPRYFDVCHSIPAIVMTAIVLNVYSIHTILSYFLVFLNEFRCAKRHPLSYNHLLHAFRIRTEYDFNHVVDRLCLRTYFY